MTAAPQPSPIDDDRARSLVDEHARLMRDVIRRAIPVLDLLDVRAWPDAELRTLASFLRANLLRQVSDEDVRLYPHDSSAPPFAELSADHVRLHVLTAQLGEVRNEPGQTRHLHALVDELLATLQRHLETEQHIFAVLSSGPDVPSVADLTAEHELWLPADDAPVLIELDKLPADQAMELCIERLLRLEPGESAELHTSDEQLERAIFRWMHAFDATRFGFDHTANGQHDLLRVTSRQANLPAGVGAKG
jgi:hypothetical protein